MSEPITIFQAILFGIVQGLTEFLPISSTAHLRILPELIGRQTDPGAGFTAVIQLGTVLAVLIYFGKDLLAAIKGWAGSFRGAKDTPEARMGWAVFWGTIPIVVLGFALRHVIKSDSMRSLYVIAGSLIVMGLVMLVAEKLGPKTRKIRSVTVKDGIIIGLWQCIALIPGASRSGSTISGALFDGFDRASAARVSFMLSVPSITAAGLYELFDERHNIMGAGLAPVLVATIVSFVVGLASIAWLIGFLQKHGIGWFVGYRILLGVALIGMIQGGMLKAQASNPETEQAPQTTSNVQAKVDPMEARIRAWSEAIGHKQTESVTPAEQAAEIRDQGGVE